MCRETALLLLAVVGGVVRSLVRIPKGGWVVLIGVPSSGQPFSALLAFHGGCLVTEVRRRFVTEVLTVTVVGDVNLRSVDCSSVVGAAFLSALGVSWRLPFVTEV
jgi:hypothetical protein